MLAALFVVIGTLSVTTLNAERVIPVSVAPTPAGYAYYDINISWDYIRLVNGETHEVPGAPKEDVVYLPWPPREIEVLASMDASYVLRPVRMGFWEPAVVVTDSGIFVYNPARDSLYYAYAPVSFAASVPNGITITVNEVVPVTGKLVSFITTDVVRAAANTMLPTHVALGLEEQCILWGDSDDGKWVGGIIDTPRCTSPITERLAESRIAGTPVVTAATLPTPYGVVTVLFAEPLVERLVEIDVLRPLNFGVGFNVTTAPTEYVYYAESRAYSITPVKRFDVATSRGDTCFIPLGADVLYAISWRAHEPEAGKSYELYPGDIIVYRYQGTDYACMGDTSWLTAVAVRSANYISELRNPVSVEALGGITIVYTSTGFLGFGSVVEVPYEYYNNAAIFYTSNGNVFYFTAQGRSVIMMLGIAALATVGVVGLIYAGTKYRKQIRDVVTVVNDLDKLGVVTHDTWEEARAEASRFVNTFGVCPTLEDYTILIKSLPPIPKDASASKPTFICPRGYDGKPDNILRRAFTSLALAGWAISRAGPRHGFFYTRLFDMKVVVPWLYVARDSQISATIDGFKRWVEETFAADLKTEKAVITGIVLLSDDRMVLNDVLTQAYVAFNYTIYTATTEAEVISAITESSLDTVASYYDRLRRLVNT